MTLDEILTRQRHFSNIFFNADALTEQDRENLTKMLSLELHAEVSSLVSAINFKAHRKEKKQPDRDKILYEGIDILRYTMAIMNVWNISSDELITAFNDKDTFLHFRQKIESNEWDGRPVAIIDMDDIVVEFRRYFLDWLRTERGVNIPYSCPEYYATSFSQSMGFNGEQLYKDFISERCLKRIPAVENAIEFTQQLRDMGYWVQLLTARPSENPLCLLDTSHWLMSSGIYFDDVAFSGEKFRWIVQSQFNGKVEFCVDDSPKHAAEFASHGLKTFSPSFSYNQSLRQQTGVIMVENLLEIIDNLKQEKTCHKI